MEGALIKLSQTWSMKWYLNFGEVFAHAIKIFTNGFLYIFYYPTNHPVFVCGVCEEKNVLISNGFLQLITRLAKGSQINPLRDYDFIWLLWHQLRYDVDDGDGADVTEQLNSWQLNWGSTWLQ